MAWTIRGILLATGFAGVFLAIITVLGDQSGSWRLLALAAIGMVFTLALIKDSRP